MLGWMNDFNDPSNFIDPLFASYSTSNMFQVNDPYLSQLIDDGHRETDELARRDIYYEIQRYIVEDLMPLIVIGQPYYQLAYSNEILSIPLNSMKIIRIYEIKTTYILDSDFDGISDNDEILIYHTDPTNPDSDFDGINDGDEVFVYMTDPANEDSDFDNLNDGLEVNYYNSDPLSVDTDNDNLLDGFEVSYGTNLLEADTDNDGYGDGIEVLSGSNPLDPSDYPGSQNENNTTTDDTATDDTSSDDTATDDDTQPLPFDNIPGYSLGVFIGISLISLALITLKKRIN